MTYPDQWFLDCGPWNPSFNWNIKAIFFAFLVSENIGCSLKRGLFSQGKRERVHPLQQVFYEHPSCTIASKFLTTDSLSCYPSNGWHNASYKIGVMSPTKSLFHLPASFLTNSLFSLIWKVPCFYQTKLWWCMQAKLTIFNNCNNNNNNNNQTIGIFLLTLIIM